MSVLFLAAAAGNIWVTLGTPIHNTVAKVLTLDTWILHKYVNNGIVF